jgi:predicted GIY-YIG superfamily endonuclease
MAGLVPAIHVLHYLIHARWLYIMASAPNGILYVGVTSDLVRRAYEHRNGLIAGFTKKYSVKRLVSSNITKPFRLRYSANTTLSTGPANGKSG